MLPYTLLDVFTDTRLAGNGLAVVHDADAVDDEVMLRFAREMRLAETTFVQTATAPGATYRNRIWTITEELPFAGHPSLGTAVAVALQRGDTEVRYVQQTPAGLQPIDVRRDGDRAQASVLQEPAVFGDEIDPGPVMAALGLRTDDAHPTLPPQLVSTGLLTMVAPVREEAVIPRVRPNREAVQRLHDESFNCYVVWPGAAGTRARARMFPSPPREAEDAATGSAAGPLLAYLHQRTGSQSVEVLQGVEMGRPSTLGAEFDSGRVRVFGGVVVLITGTVRLP
jgi:trans-2,3-dihydro-3-hydroxyanthranilate isomerase